MLDRSASENRLQSRNLPREKCNKQYEWPLDPREDVEDNEQVPQSTRDIVDIRDCGRAGRPLDSMPSKLCVRRCHRESKTRACEERECSTYGKVECLPRDV